MKTKLLTTAAELLATRTLKRETVPVPQFGEGAAVLVQELSLNRRMVLSQYMEPYKDDANRGWRWFTALVVLGVIDEAGEPVLTIEDAEKLGDQSMEAIESIADVVQRLSGLNRKEEERPFAGTPNDASSSDSPESSA